MTSPPSFSFYHFYFYYDYYLLYYNTNSTPRRSQVPLISLALGVVDFGARTWAACAAAFGAAVLTTVVDHAAAG